MCSNFIIDLAGKSKQLDSKPKLCLNKQNLLLKFTEIKI